MAEEREELSDEAIGRRLWLIRMALGFEDQGEYCAEINISQPGYSQAETGTQRMGINSLMKICLRFPEISLDYIFLGRDALMPRGILDKIKKLEEAD